MATTTLLCDRFLMAPIRDDPDRVCGRAIWTKRKQLQINMIARCYDPIGFYAWEATAWKPMLYRSRIA